MFKVKEILYNLGLAMIMLSFCRILFIVFNLNFISEHSYSEIIYAIFHGLRFDASYLGYALSIYLLIVFLPIPNKKATKINSFLRILFTILLGISILPNLIDVEYIKFTGKRMSSEIVSMTPDIVNQISQLLFNYIHIFLIFIFVIFTSWKLYKPLLPTNNKLGYRIITFAFFSISLILIIRGGIQLRPLQPFHAFNSHHDRMAIVTLNSGFSIIHSLEKNKLKKHHFFPTNKEAVEVINKYTCAKYLPKTEAKHENVIIFILESFTSEYTGLEEFPSYTPFLDSLAKEGVSFPNHYANGRRSIDALPPILYGLPNYLDETLIYSNYQSNTIIGMPTILHKNGYHTAFFHGGKNGTFSFDAMAKKSGYNEYYGLNEYPDIKDFDGNWGIYDDRFFNFSLHKMNSFKQPFLGTIFSLSSHNPFKIPERFKDRFPKGTMDIHESIGYTDYSLRQFFGKAKKTDWFKNTLFVFTADHSQKTHLKKYQSYLGWFDIPLVFFHPSKKVTAKNRSAVYQHKDIPKTILNYVGIENSISVFSSDILQCEGDNYGLTYENDIYKIFNNKYTIVFNGKIFNAFESSDTLEKYPIKENTETVDLENLLKAIIQVYNNGMIANKISKISQLP